MLVNSLLGNSVETNSSQIHSILDTEEIHNYIQYKMSMTVFMARISNKRKVPFENYKSESLNVHILGTYGHIHTKYEVSLSNPVAKGGVDRQQ